VPDMTDETLKAAPEIADDETPPADGTAALRETARRDGRHGRRLAKYRGLAAELNRPNLKDEIAAHLRNMILSGALHPGDKIMQDEIAEELAVSKQPVREALIALESEGMIDNVPRQGSFVAMLEPEDVVDHYIIFGMLSGLAAERAAARLEPEQFDELERLFLEMSNETDPHRQEQLNSEFHGIINRVGGSMRLRSVLRTLAKSLPSRFFEVATDWNIWAATDHREILDALKARDGTRAAMLMQRHLQHGGDVTVRGLREAGFWSS
jgi:DNA-binding GntR family transcriptional regulator